MTKTNTKHDAHVRAYIKFANAIARAAGHGKATKIVRNGSNQVVSHVNFGYRKLTTGEYVQKAYLRNFGWKNTYYQSAETVVSVA